MYCVSAILIILAFLYYKLSQRYKYWTNNGVPQGQPRLFFGDTADTLLRKRSVAAMIDNIYKLCPGRRYFGIYQFFTPTLLIRDQDLIKQITIKDFDHFSDHRNFAPDASGELISKNLFGLKGKEWREMRNTLSPTFTSSKMRQMFGLIVDVSENFSNYLIKQPLINGVLEIEVKDLFTRFANDMIASIAFGVKVDSLTDKENEFFRMGKDATNFSNLSRILKFFCGFLFPSIFKMLRLSFLGKEINIFFLNLIEETIKVREEKKIVRPDMVHLLLEAKKGKKIDDDNKDEIDAGFAAVQESDIDKTKSKIQITNFDIAAQALVFFFAGFDSVSSLMSFTAHELAEHPDIQNKLRQEIDSIDGKLTYEKLIQMKYLDMVISETLRRYPNSVATDRVCTKPYVIQPSTPDEKPVHLNPGDMVLIPIYGLHHDPQYFPDPYKFDPERFSDENKANITPYMYLPFGVGPRSCIGSRLALLETKVVLYYILKNFELVVTPKTKIPLELSKKAINLAVDGGIWIGLKPIKKDV